MVRERKERLRRRGVEVAVGVRVEDGDGDGDGNVGGAKMSICSRLASMPNVAGLLSWERVGWMR